MTYLLDTHLLLWVTGAQDRLSSQARTLLADAVATPVFSTASIWEVVIKQALGRKDFLVEPSRLRDDLMENGYDELEIRSEHVLEVAALPLIHKDPFDRMLIAQARVEGITLLTGDAHVVRYGAPVQLI